MAMEFGRDCALWQAAILLGIFGWMSLASSLKLTRKVRALTQPWVNGRVQAETKFILRLQKIQNGFYDAFFTIVSCVVSVPFYTGFLPLLFWSGHAKLARQMVLLMAFCNYIGNSIKDVVSAPRPSCPPVRRVAATSDEKENAMEYGLPSSHCLNTLCLAGYMSHYVLTNTLQSNDISVAMAIACVFMVVMLIGIARIYLGMHSPIDVAAGIIFGIVILFFWLAVHEYTDGFIISKHNVTSFWAGLSFLLCFAYPRPELPTPSFDYHTAFNGVAFGIVTGVQQTYLHFHHEDVPQLFGNGLPLTVFLGRMLVGIPTILIVKFCSKVVAIWLLPMICNTLGIPIVSSCYVPTLKSSHARNSKGDSKQLGYFRRLRIFLDKKAYNIDTGIRFLQYAGLAWSVVDLVPSLFSYLKL